MTAEKAMEKIKAILDGEKLVEEVLMSAGWAIGKMERTRSEIEKVVKTWEKTKPRYEVMAFCGDVLCSLGEYRKRRDAESVWSSVSKECSPYIVDLEEKKNKRKRK